MTKESSLLSNDECHSNTTPMKKSTSGQRLTGRALSANWDKKTEPDGGTELNGGTLEDGDNEDYAADDEGQKPMNPSRENEVFYLIIINYFPINLK